MPSSPTRGGNGGAHTHLGRGETAVQDMKRRLAAMKNSGMDGNDIINALWDRNIKANTGNGYTYEFAEQ